MTLRTYYSPGIRLGLLGGGQLARMLAQSAHHFGLTPWVFTPKSSDPGSQVTAFTMQSPLAQLESLKSFLNSVDLATFESEFMDSQMLEKAQNQSQTPIFPSPQIMGILQDRESQKQLLDKMGISNAPWRVVNQVQDVESFINEQGLPLVFKQRTNGYDGYGTHIIHNEDDLSGFLKTQFQPSFFIVEKWIPFKKEMACIVARSKDGSCTHLPLVESHQKEARCFWVKGPVKQNGFRSMIDSFFNLLNKIEYVGVMGIEFFQTSGKLIVNEIAPRVHNTGHYSLDTPGPSQFDLHILCLLGEKLPPPSNPQGGFAMVNLIGQGLKEVQLPAFYGVHWYGKLENRKGRKMGHINTLGETPSLALKEALDWSRKAQL